MRTQPEGLSYVKRDIANGLSYIKRGRGEFALVLLHYFGGAAESWQWVAGELEDELRTFAINLPGYGESPALAHPSLRAYADAVRGCIEELRVDSYAIAGHSMGGKIALQLAASEELPGLEQVILVAPSPPTREPMPDSERQRLSENHPSRENAATTVEQATRRPLSESQRETAITTHVGAENAAWQWWLRDGMNAPVTGSVRVPTTVLASRQDPVIPFSKLQEDFSRLLPEAAFVEIPDVGHLIPLEEPAKLAREIANSVRRAGALDDTGGSQYSLTSSSD